MHKVFNVMPRAPTVVKDTQKLLPISLDRHKRVLIISTDIVKPLRGEDLQFILLDLLSAKGFDVSIHQPFTDIDTNNFDLILYLMGEETLLTRGHLFLDLVKLGGTFRHSMQRTWHHVPTAMISFGYPHYLYGAPRIPTYINAYATMDAMQEAVVDLLLGHGKWKGSNPVDPFSGAPDSKY